MSHSSPADHPPRTNGSEDVVDSSSTPSAADTPASNLTTTTTTTTHPPGTVQASPLSPLPHPVLRPPVQVIRTPLPRLFVYDHCPFCVRVRHLLGAKHVKYELVWLANDDVHTPTNLVGRKVVPIFQPNGHQGSAVMESLDICRAVDADPDFGPVHMFRPSSGRNDISTWMDATAELQRRLIRPRHVRAPLPEFVFADARAAFVKNHPLKPPRTSYEDNLADSPALVAQLAARLPQLDDLIFCEQYCSEGGLSMDDIALFAKLRSFTIIRDLVIPEKMMRYIQFHSELAEIPLYTAFAI